MSTEARRKQGGNDALFTGVASALVVAIVAIPIFNSLPVPRRLGALPTGPIDDLTLWLGIGLAAVALVLSAANPRVVPWPTAAGWFLALAAWLGFRYLGQGDLSALVNTVFIALTAISAIAVCRRQIDWQAPAIWTFRVAAGLSIVLLAVSPGWYIDASAEFVDSGKIFPQLPNMQGILTHPNYTGLYFAIAAVLQVWRLRAKPDWIGALSILIFASIVVTTQARSALLAIVVALAVMLMTQFGRTAPARLALLLLLIVSTLPFIMMLPAFLISARPDFSLLAPLGPRQGLWTGVAEIIPRAPFIGQGTSGIVQTRGLVTEADVLMVTHAHNQILTLILAGGLVAAFLFLVWLGVLIRSIRHPDAALTAGFTAVLIMTSFSETALTDYFPLPGVTLILLTLMTTCREPERSDDRTNRRSRVPAPSSR